MPPGDVGRRPVADYVKLPEVARRLDVSEKTARRMVKSGRLPAVFIGGAYRVSEEDLAGYLESSKVDPGKVKAPPSSEQPDFNGLLEEQRRRAEREKLIEVLPGWTRAALENEEFVHRFEAAKGSPERARDLVIRQRKEADSIIAKFRDLKERSAPPAEVEAAKRDLRQARAREMASTFMEMDLWRGKDVADVRPVDILAEVAAAWGDLGAALSGEDDVFASEAG